MPRGYFSLGLGLSLALAGCVDRDLGEARVEAARLLRVPVICEGQSGNGCRNGEANSGGFFCQAGDGRTVYCSGDEREPCQVLYDKAEVPTAEVPTPEAQAK